jgi:hypothetical protein
MKKKKGSALEKKKGSALEKRIFNSSNQFSTFKG